jgi:hypothetical protein
MISFCGKVLEIFFSGQKREKFEFFFQKSGIRSGITTEHCLRSVLER